MGPQDWHVVFYMRGGHFGGSSPIIAAILPRTNLAYYKQHIYDRHICMPWAMSPCLTCIIKGCKPSPWYCANVRCVHLNCRKQSQKEARKQSVCPLCRNTTTIHILTKHTYIHTTRTPLQELHYRNSTTITQDSPISTRPWVPTTHQPK